MMGIHRDSSLQGVVHHAPGAPELISRTNLRPRAQGAPALIKPSLHPKLTKGMSYSDLFKAAIGSGSGDVVRPERVASIRHAGRSYEVHQSVVPGADGGDGGREYTATINGESQGGKPHATLAEAVGEMKLRAMRDGWRAPLGNAKSPTDFYGGPDDNASSHPSHPEPSRDANRASPAEFSGNSTSSGF
jgi:hypothetical protein